MITKIILISISSMLIVCIWYQVNKILIIRRKKKIEKRIKNEEIYQEINKNQEDTYEKQLIQLKKDWPLNTKAIYLGIKTFVVDHNLKLSSGQDIAEVNIHLYAPEDLHLVKVSWGYKMEIYEQWVRHKSLKRVK